MRGSWVISAGRLPDLSTRKAYANISAGLLGKILSNPTAVVASHWMFQSLPYMDRTERVFKLSLDLFAFAVSWLVLSKLLATGWAVILAALGAHTLNFLLNGHLWGALKNFGHIRRSREEFEAYARASIRRCVSNSSVRAVYLVGSSAGGSWSPSSDLDIRILRAAGTKDALRSCLLALCERARAFLTVFPIDIYVADSPSRLRMLGVTAGNSIAFEHLSEVDAKLLERESR